MEETRSSEEPVYKKFFLGFLITTTLGICFSKGTFMLIATFNYFNMGFPWFEWLNYLFLSFFVIICVPLTLLFLESVYVRRGLRLFMLGMVIINALEFYEGLISHASTLFFYERPFNAIFIGIEAISALICWLVILRQWNGRSLLPIPVKTKMSSNFYSIKQGLSTRWNNLKDFIERPKPEKKTLINAVLLVNIIIFSGLLITMTQEDQPIVLERPQDHEMKVKFWTSGNQLEDSTLEILGRYDIDLYAWISLNFDENGLVTYNEFSGMDRYGDYGVGFYKQISPPWEENEYADFIEYINRVMDWCDANPKVPFKGFVSDWERAFTVARYNETHFHKNLEFLRVNVTKHVKLRGYEYAYVETLNTIGDLYDGDYDVTVAYGAPFNPVAFENCSAFNVMVYRMEMAMTYDEPYEYFTYQWANAITNYMEFIEERYEYPDGYWTSRSGMSIGVTSNYFYSYNQDRNQYALAEFINDVKICHACEIGEIAIFYFKNNSHFHEMWGDDGVETMMQELNSYEQIVVPYQRRGSFFGNLKWLSNPAGSVFGLAYCDVLYEAWVGILALVWIGSFIAVCGVFTRFSFKKNEEKPRENSRSNDKNNFSTSIRFIYFATLIGLLVWALLIQQISPVSPELLFSIGDIL